MESGFEHVPVIPIIVALIIIGVATYLIRRRRQTRRTATANDADHRPAPQ